jgi:hypothetical protein
MGDMKHSKDKCSPSIGYIERKKYSDTTQQLETMATRKSQHEAVALFLA